MTSLPTKRNGSGQNCKQMPLPNSALVISNGFPNKQIRYYQQIKLIVEALSNRKTEKSMFLFNSQKP